MERIPTGCLVTESNINLGVSGKVFVEVVNIYISRLKVKEITLDKMDEPHPVN